MTTCRKCRKRKATVVLINRHTNKDVPLCDTCNHSKVQGVKP